MSSWKHVLNGIATVSLEFVGCMHANYYCQSRESASYHNCRYYNKNLGNYQLVTVHLIKTVADTTKVVTMAVVAAAINRRY